MTHEAIPTSLLDKAARHTLELFRLALCSEFIGYGGFGLVMGKPTLLQLYDAAGFGVFGVPLPAVSAVMGGFDMLLGVLCLEVNVAAFFLFVCAWKLGTEFFHVPAQAYGAWWEVLERGSSYAARLLWTGFHQFVHDHGAISQGLIPRTWLRRLGRGYRRLHARLLP
jgi:hypothetical protein